VLASARLIEWDDVVGSQERSPTSLGVTPRLPNVGFGPPQLAPKVRLSTERAAWNPHIPWTPPPGGVEAEHR